jgi:hypothetical protein
MKITVVWVVEPCTLIEIYQRYRRSCAARCLLIALMMEAVGTSETSVNFYQITRRNNPEDSHLQTEYCPVR